MSNYLDICKVIIPSGSIVIQAIISVLTITGELLISGKVINAIIPLHLQLVMKKVTPGDYISVS